MHYLPVENLRSLQQSFSYLKPTVLDKLEAQLEVHCVDKRGRLDLFSSCFKSQALSAVACDVHTRQTEHAGCMCGRM